MPDAAAACSLSRMAHKERPSLEVVRYMVAAITTARMTATTGKADGSVPMV